MKTLRLLPFLLSLLISSQSTAQTRTVLKQPPNGTIPNALLEPLATGANTFKISATGTLEFVNGFGLTGGSYLKTALSLNNVENTALSTWAGSVNVTTLGTISTGVWHGTAIGLDYLAAGGATDGQILAFSDGAWIPVTLGFGLFVGTTEVTGGTPGRLLYNNAGVLGELALVPVGNGGTGQTSLQASINALAAASGALSQGDLLYFNGTNLVRLAAGTAGKYLQTQGSGANPQWGSVSSSANGIEWSSSDGGGRLAVMHGLYGDLTISTDGLAAFKVDRNIVADGDGRGIGANSDAGVYSGQFYASKDTNNCLELSRGTGTHAVLRVNGTRTDKDNYERLALITTAGDYTLAPEAAGTGTLRDLIVGAAGSKTSIAGSLAVGPAGTTHSKIKSGVATLSGGTVTVSDSDVKETGTASTSSRIFVTRMTDGGTVGSYSLTRINTTSFTITSTSGTETSTVSWMMINP